jgi:L-lactate utilization protein LutB
LKQKCALTEKGSMKQRREQGDDGEAEGTIRVKRRKTTEEAETGLERVERKLDGLVELVKLVLTHQKMEISRLDRVLDLLGEEGSDNGDDAYGEEDRNEVAEVVGATEGKKSERTEGKKDAGTEGSEPMLLD